MRRPCDWARRVLLRAAVVLGLGIGCGSPEQVLLGMGITTSSADASLDVAAPDGGRVLGFELVDVTTGLDLRPLADGDTIVTTGAPVNLRAVVQLPNPGSVVFAVDGQQVRIEEHAPFAIAGNDPITGAYYAWHIAAGTHQVAATPYSAPSGGGVPGVGLQQTFKIQ